MTTYNDAWQAGIDAVVADTGLNRGGFADAIRTVLTARFSNSEATSWIDAVATEFERLNIINNPTYNNLRGNILDDPVAHRELFDSLATIPRLPETAPAVESALLITLREERDNIDAAIDRLNVLIAAEPNGVVGRLVKETMRQGKDNLRGRKEEVRNQIRNITGDPDG